MSLDYPADELGIQRPWRVLILDARGYLLDVLLSLLLRCQVGALYLRQILVDFGALGLGDEALARLLPGSLGLLLHLGRELGGLGRLLLRG